MVIECHVFCTIRTTTVTCYIMSKSFQVAQAPIVVQFLLPLTNVSSDGESLFSLNLSLCHLTSLSLTLSCLFSFFFALSSRVDCFRSMSLHMLLEYTHTSIPLKHSTMPLDDTTNATHTRVRALLLSHPGLRSTRVGPDKDTHGTPVLITFHETESLTW